MLDRSIAPLPSEFHDHIHGHQAGKIVTALVNDNPVRHPVNLKE